MQDISWYKIQDLYTVEKYKIRHSKTPKTKWVRLNCVYKIKINSKIVHVGRSDTCKKHGGAEKVRKALVNLLNIHKPNSSNIRIGIIETNAIKKTYLQERI